MTSSLHRCLAAACVCLAVAALCMPARMSAADTRPNILFIIFDDWGWNHSGAYGAGDWIKTPNFDRIAEEGALFNNCFTSNPKCCPCRASILTGRNTWQLKEVINHNTIWPREFETFPDMLEAAGYYIGLTGKGWAPGNYERSGRTRNPAGPLFDKYQSDPPAKGINHKAYAKNFGEFLKNRPKDKPFSFWMGFHEPHRAYELDSGIRMGKDPAAAELPEYFPDLGVVRRDMLDYAVEVEWGDGQIGEALQLLQSEGVLDNTVIVVTSDHGMPFPRVKGQILEDGFHLPLAIRWGTSIKPGRVVEDFINVRDFAPTFLQLAGLPVHPQMTGRSFTDVLTAEKSGWVDGGRSVMLVGKERHDLGRPFNWGYPVRAIRTLEYLYIHNYFPDRWPACDPETDYGNCDASPTKELLKSIGGYFYNIAFGQRPADELYRITDDPECLRNLANDPAFTPVMEDLRNRMLTMLKEEGDLRALGRPEFFDTIEYVTDSPKAYDKWLKSLEK